MLSISSKKKNQIFILDYYWLHATTKNSIQKYKYKLITNVDFNLQTKHLLSLNLNSIKCITVYLCHISYTNLINHANIQLSINAYVYKYLCMLITQTNLTRSVANRNSNFKRYNILNLL